MNMRDDTFTATTIEAVAVAHGMMPSLPGGESESPYEYLGRTLEKHINNERGVFDRYRDLAESSGDPVVRLIMGLILEDEERHHSIMRQIVSRLQDDLAWKRSPDSLPDTMLTAPSPAEHEALRQFVASEHTGVQDLREFGKEAEGLYQGVAGALIEMMIFDSQKHEQLLRFLYRRTGEALAQQAER